MIVEYNHPLVIFDIKYYQQNKTIWHCFIPNPALLSGRQLTASLEGSLCSATRITQPRERFHQKSAFISLVLRIWTRPQSCYFLRSPYVWNVASQNLRLAGR